MSLRPLRGPRPARVVQDARGLPAQVEAGGRRRRVEAVRDDWLVQDLWWTGRPVHRHYFELVLEPGRLTVVYRDAADGRWFVQG
ncbi:hypothetical protein [Miltoncostaea marina]|uniref:hypothetical protein n=1 Tax=Miltoncostaea marina TaxID=2843215 RepID=UPI001C3D1FE6|nr:hypothetical protein [Miltoncostaea marina]